MMTAAPLTLRSLTAFDWLLVVVVACSTVAAFRRGIVKVLFSLAGVVAGILLASWNYVALAHRLERWISSFAAAEVIAFVIILAVVIVLFSLAASLLRRTVSAIGLGVFDRLLGAAFGLLRGILIGVAAMMAIAAFAPRTPWLRDSRLAPYFLAGAHAVSFVVPERFAGQIASGAATLLQNTPEIFRSHAPRQPM